MFAIHSRLARPGGVVALLALPFLAFYSTFGVPLVLIAASWAAFSRSREYFLHGTRTLSQFRNPPSGLFEYDLPPFREPIAEWVIGRLDGGCVGRALESGSHGVILCGATAIGAVWCAAFAAVAAGTLAYAGRLARPTYVVDLRERRLWRPVVARALGDAAWTTIARTCLVALLVGTLALILVPLWTGPTVPERAWWPYVPVHAAVVAPAAFFLAFRSHLRWHTERALPTESSRCSTCNYPMNGLTSPKCPECASSLPAERRPFPVRTRLPTNRTLGACSVGLALAVGMWWWFAGSAPHGWLTQNLPGWAMHSGYVNWRHAVRAAPTGVLRLEVGPWYRIGAHPDSRVGIALRIFELPHDSDPVRPGSVEHRVFLQVVTCLAPDESFRVPIDQIIESPLTAASGGVISLTSLTRVWIGRSLFECVGDVSPIPGKTLVELRTSDFAPWGDFVRMDSRPTNDPLVDAMDALDWSWLERRPGRFEICPSPRPASEVRGHKALP